MNNGIVNADQQKILNILNINFSIFANHHKSLLMDPVDNLSYYRWGMFYFNKEDIRTVVPKRSRYFGYTLNFANWKSYIFVAFIILVPLISSYL